MFNKVHTSIMSMLLLLSILLYSVHSAEPNCTDISNCFEVHIDEKTFFEANLICREKNLTLATVVSRAQMTSLHSKIKEATDASNPLFWIGLHDTTVTGKYEWISQYPSLPQAYWSKNVSDSIIQLPNHCVVVDSKALPYNSWITQTCGTPAPFVCGPVIPDNPVPPTHLLGYCPNDFQRVLNRCFKIYSAQVSWNEAWVGCNATGASLATIMSNEEQSHLTAMMKGTNNNLWLGMATKVDSHEWINNQTITFTNWKKGEPSSAKQETCVFMYNRLSNVGEWNDERCTKPNGYLCENALIAKGTHNNEDNALFMQGKCVNGFMEYQDTCYYLPPSGNYTFDATLEICAKQNVGNNSYLVVPHSRFEFAFLQALLAHGSWLNNIEVATTWLGLHYTFSPIYSLNIADKEDFGINEYFTPLFHPEASNASLCVAMPADGNPLHIKHWYCNQSLPSRPVCAYKLDTHPLHPNVTESSYCPPMWKKYGTGCYMAMRSRATFHDAELQCNQMNSHLVSIHSDWEKQIVMDQIGKDTDNPYWIGLQAKNFEDITFEWTDSTLFNYSQFRSGEPSKLNKHNQSEDCISIRSKSFDWNDEVCSKPMRFICKAPLLHVNCSGFDFAVNEVCYKHVPTPMSWNNASQYCYHQLNQSFLPQPTGHILDRGAMQKLRENPNVRLKQFWSGLKWTPYTSAPLQWSDGTVLNFLRWQSPTTSSSSSLFDDATSTSLCMSMTADVSSQDPNGTSWWINSCTEKLPFTCARNASKPSQPMPEDKPYLVPRETATIKEETVSCPDGFVVFGSTCYKLVNESLNYLTAKKHCETKYNAHLAFVKTWHDNMFLSSLGFATNYNFIWIGVYIESASNAIDRLDNSKPNYLPPLMNPWKKADNQSDVSRWYVALNNNGHPHEQGLWIPMKANETFPFLCEKSAEVKKSGVAKMVNSCNGDEKWYNNYCYSVKSEKKTFEEAAKFCSRSSSELLTVYSSYEEHFLISWLTNRLDVQLDDQFWLSLKIPSSSPNTKELLWTDGRRVEYTHFPQSLSLNEAIKQGQCVTLKFRGFSSTAAEPVVWQSGIACHQAVAQVVCRRFVGSQENAPLPPVEQESLHCQNLQNADLPHQASYKTQHIGRSDRSTYSSNAWLQKNRSKDNHSCWRWDMVPNHQLQHYYFPMSLLFGGRGHLSYLGNRCTTFFNSTSQTTQTYGCYVSAEEWQACTPIVCLDPTPSTSSGMVVVLLLLIAIMMLFTLVALLVYARRHHRFCFRYNLLPNQQHDVRSFTFGESDDDVTLYSGGGTAFHNPIYRPTTVVA